MKTFKQFLSENIPNPPSENDALHGLMTQQERDAAAKNKWELQRGENRDVFADLVSKFINSTGERDEQVDEGDHRHAQKVHGMLRALQDVEHIDPQTDADSRMSRIESAARYFHAIDFDYAHREGTNTIVTSNRKGSRRWIDTEGESFNKNDRVLHSAEVPKAPDFNTLPMETQAHYINQARIAHDIVQQHLTPSFIPTKGKYTFGDDETIDNDEGTEDDLTAEQEHAAYIAHLAKQIQPPQ